MGFPFSILVAIVYILKALIWIIIIDCVLTFIPSVNRRHPIVEAIRRITEPMYRQVRRLVPAIRTSGMGLDLASLIVILGLNFLIWIVIRL